jgi:hypothetical protein
MFNAEFDMINRADGGGSLLATVQSGLNQQRATERGHLIFSSRFASAGNQYTVRFKSYKCLLCNL